MGSGASVSTGTSEPEQRKQQLVRQLTKDVKSNIAKACIYIYAALGPADDFASAITAATKRWLEIRSDLFAIMQIANNATADSLGLPTIAPMPGHPPAPAEAYPRAALVFVVVALLYLRRGWHEDPVICPYGEDAFNFIRVLLNNEPCNCICSSSFIFAALEEMHLLRRKGNVSACIQPRHILVQIGNPGGRGIMAQIETTFSALDGSPVDWIENPEVLLNLSIYFSKATPESKEFPFSKTFKEHIEKTLVFSYYKTMRAEPPEHCSYSPKWSVRNTLIGLMIWAREQEGEELSAKVEAILEILSIFTAAAYPEVRFADLKRVQGPGDLASWWLRNVSTSPDREDPTGIYLLEFLPFFVPQRDRARIATLTEEMESLIFPQSAKQYL